MLNKITPIVITYNEEVNIERSLSKLTWATNVLLIDSFSTDNTLDIAKQFKNVSTVQRNFDGFASQCNFGLQHPAVKTDWVLNLDADYILTDEIINEINKLTLESNISGYETEFQYMINGKPLRACLYPSVITLFNKSVATYKQDGHAHRVEINGEIKKLNHKIQHDDRKPYQRWRSAQKKYAIQEADKLSASSWKELSLNDKIRCIPMLAPLIVFPYTLFIKGTLLDGAAGLTYTYQRVTAEWLLQKARFHKLLKL